MNLRFNLDPLETDVTVTANGAAISLWVKNPKNDARAYVFRRTETQECVFVDSTDGFDKLCDIESKINGDAKHLEAPLTKVWREKCAELAAGRAMHDSQINSLRYQLDQARLQQERANEQTVRARACADDSKAHMDAALAGAAKLKEESEARTAELENLRRCHSEQFNTVQALQLRLIERAKRISELEDMNKNAVAMHALAVEQRDSIMRTRERDIAALQGKLDHSDAVVTQMRDTCCELRSKQAALREIVDVKKSECDTETAALQAIIMAQKDTILGLRQKLTLACTSAGVIHRELSALP